VTPPQRIISTAPSITETLFSLKLEDRLIGVSRFCKYPAAAQNIPKVGGFLDPDYETMLRLKPDVVILLKESTAVREKLESLGVTCLAVDHRSIEGIMASFRQIADYCGVSPQGEELLTNIQSRLDLIRTKTADRASAQRLPPRVLLTLRMEPERNIRTVTAAGSNPFFQKVLELAGAKNALENPRTPFPVISREGIYELNPDAVIDLASGETGFSEAAFQQGWQDFGEELNAVRDGRIYLITEDYAMIPGPRFILLIERLAELLDE
jgi:iron complex transport system substrate-binding protein